MLDPSTPHHRAHGILRWQRLKPFEKFAELIERHWNGITA